MIKKTYIRVITLILAALMMFSMLAPMFSRVAFAASLLEVSNVGGEAAGNISGTPTSLYSVGDYEITVESPTTEQLGIKKDEGSKETVSAVFDDGNKVFRYGGLRFEKKDKAEWQEGDTVTFSIVSTATDGEPKITASNASTSRVRKGRQVTLNLTIVDTNFIFNQDEVEIVSAVSSYCLNRVILNAAEQILIRSYLLSILTASFSSLFSSRILSTLEAAILPSLPLVIR